MKKTWLIGSMLASGLAAVIAVACNSSSNNGGEGGAATTTTTTHTTTTTTGTGTTTSTSTTTHTGTGGAGAGGAGGTGAAGGAGGGQCSSVTTLHPPQADAGANTIYCPFSGQDGGPNDYCTAVTEHCCETPANSTPSACQPSATPCTLGPGYTDWQCEDPVADCTDPNKPVCCATSASGFTASIGLGSPGCGNFAHHMIGTQCVAAGACDSIVMCTSDPECPDSQTCTPFGKAGAQVGGCM